MVVGFLPPVSRYRLTLRREEGGPQQPDDSHLLTQGCSALFGPLHGQVDSTLVTWTSGNQAAAVKSRHVPGCCFGWNAVCVSDRLTDRKKILWSTKGKKREGN